MELKIIDVKPVIKTVAIITPTIGKDSLEQCMSSVRDQVFDGNIKHYIVVDGKEHFQKVTDLLNRYGWEKESSLRLVMLPENVGAEGWYGHRVYAAFSFLFNADAVSFLDEDNWVDVNHTQSLVNTMNENQSDWTFSFRKIYDKDGNYLLHDNCESLGIHPTYVDQNSYHIDTSSYLVREDVARRIGGAWYGKWGADRQYLAVLAQHFTEFAPSKEYSLCYRLGGNEGSVSKEFFEVGNEKMKAMYGDNFPWTQA